MENLNQFTGTENYYYNPMYNWMRYTDGVKYFAENAGGGAYWFLDILGTELKQYIGSQPFISVKLNVTENNTATITVDDGNNNIIRQRTIGYTDCPPGEYLFFLTDCVLMLSSEY